MITNFGTDATLIMPSSKAWIERFRLLQWKGVERIDKREYIECSLAQPVLSIYVASHHLDVAPQESAKDQCYCTVYYITLNSNCEAQGVSKNLKKM